MKLKYDTSTIEGKIAVMERFREDPAGLLYRGTLYADWAPYGHSGCPRWDWFACNYNYAAEPTLKPWTFETAPRGDCWLRLKQAEGSIFQNLHRITYIGEKGVHAAHWQFLKPFEKVLNDYEHSLDGGKTWLPCGTEE